MPDFAFAVGDFVTLVAEADRAAPTRFQVLERMTQECPGGTQRHYAVRIYSNTPDGKVMASTLNLLDIEVAAYPDAEELAKRRAAEVDRLAEEEEAVFERRYKAKKAAMPAPPG